VGNPGIPSPVPTEELRQRRTAAKPHYRAVRPSSQRRRTRPLGLLRSSRPWRLGAVVGIVTALIPVALVVWYRVSFALTATTDGALNILVQRVVAAIVLDAALTLVAAVLLLFRHSRLVGAGFLLGTGTIAAIAAVAFLVFVAVSRAFNPPTILMWSQRL
jgi:hypothetical protein